MEVLLLQGEGKDVRAIAEQVMALKGVKNVKLTTIRPEQEV
jgi:CopG family nickel-responsive transcriptional regulator